MTALALTVTAGTAGYAAEAEAEQQPDSALVYGEYAQDLNEAKEVLRLICGTELFADSESVNRADFIRQLIYVTKTTAAAPETYYFEDVPAFDQNADNIYTAAELGWISKSKAFEPTREIRPDEALKILLSMMGYRPMAEAQGGYPLGYLRIASVTGMTNGIETAKNTLSSNDVYLLLFRALTTSVPKQTVFGNKQGFETGYEDMLSVIYNVRRVKGRITATPYNSLRGSEPEYLKETVEIEGTVYDSELAAWDILGAGVRAYILESRNTGVRGRVIYMRDLSERSRADLTNIIDKSGNTVQYWDESGNRKKRIVLSENCSFILNGRKVTDNIDSLFVPDCGEVIFSGSESLSDIDTVYINRYSYITVGQKDYVNETVSDKNSFEYMLSFGDALYCIGTDGSNSDYKTLNSGEIYRVIKSADGKFIAIKKITEKIEGVIKRTQGDKIYIDDTEYKLSKYYLSTRLSEIKAGANAAFICDGNIIVSISSSGSAMQYGYWTACSDNSPFGNEIKAKIFTSSGEFKIYPLKKKLMIDGVAGLTYRDAYTMFAQTPQLIRFGLNGGGEIAYIDFATTQQPEQPGVYPDERNMLTYHNYLPQSMRYRNGALMAYVNLASTMIFSVPSDITQDELFLVQNQKAMVHDRDYSAQIYNLDDCGMAEVMVYVNDSPYQISKYATPMLIESVELGLDKEGNEAYIVNGFHESTFKQLYLGKDINVTKSAAAGTVVDSVHPLLSGGDLISYAADPDGSIKDIKVIFDARTGVFKESRTDNFNVDAAKTEMYFGGQVYSNSAGSRYMTISFEQTARGYDFSPSKLRYISTNTKNIAEYNAKTGVVRPVSVNEMKTYKQNGEDAHFAVVHQDAFSTKCIILYTESEERKND